MTKRDLELEVARLRGQVDVLTEALRHAQQPSPSPWVPPVTVPYWQVTPGWPWPYGTWCGSSGNISMDINGQPFITSDGHQATFT